MSTPQEITPLEYVNSIGDYIFKRPSSGDRGFDHKIVERDILLYGWLFQTKYTPGKIERVKLQKYIGTSSKMMLNSILGGNLANFIKGDIHQEFKFSPELIDAIKSENRLLFGKGSIYKLDQLLPFTKDSSNQMTGLDFVERMNLFSSDIDDGHLLNVVVEVLHKLLPETSSQYINEQEDKRFKLLKGPRRNSWQLVVGVIPFDGTLKNSKDDIKIYYDFLYENGVSTKTTLFILPSIDGDGEIAVEFDINKNRYCFWGVSTVAFLNLLAEYFDTKEKQEKAAEFFPEIFKSEIANSSRYSSSYALELLRKATGIFP